MTRVDRIGFIAHCTTCGQPVNLDATPEAVCGLCQHVVCDQHYPHQCVQEVTC